ncbi:hypothetical protein [Streptomyces boncukensis]|uniref:Uncharacterized protein n=1 Tax=Streptomyces boncukensis TaxID=2711219 RepID=A0A6G4WTH9_9ACTN|nr:hypothetical protein [Streptomyces boncukensis]NGO68515.1 hypothetical protein [Streptomyces boncukensis]
MDTQITAYRDGTGVLSVNGVDISRAAAGVILRVDPQRGETHLVVDVQWPHVDMQCPQITAEADATVTIPDRTARALVALGWTPPDGQPAPGHDDIGKEG